MAGCLALSDKVIYLEGETTLPVPVDRVCEGAKEMQYVVIMGIGEDGNWELRSSESDVGKLLLTLERCKQIALEAVEE